MEDYHNEIQFSINDEDSEYSNEEYYQDLPKSQEDVFAHYPTMIDSYERTIEYNSNPYYDPDIIHELFIIYTNGKTIMLDTYYKEERVIVPEVYEFANSKTLNKAICELNKFDCLYSFLEYAHYIHFTHKFQLLFWNWLDIAREKIVARETHPSRVNALLESGVDLDNIDKAIDSKLAGKLSW